MDNKTKQSTLAEQMVIVDMLKNDVEVYTQINGKSKFDLVINVGDRLLSMQIKSTSYLGNPTSYSVQLKSVRANRTNNIIHPFNGTSVDILAVVIPDRDAILYFKADTILNRSCLNIPVTDIYNYPFNRLLRDYTRDTPPTEVVEGNDIVQTTTQNTVANES